MDIKLNFINMSNDAQLKDIVFFQKNIATDFETIITAWKVIRYCGYGNCHPFIYPTDCEISANDSYGNFTPHLAASPGQEFHVSCGPSGNQLTYKQEARGLADIELSNDLERGAIGANIFKGGYLFARKTMIAPGQKAVFCFKPSLMVAVGSQIIQGSGLDSMVISNQATELGLLGIHSADIILHGGGPGSESRPFSLHLDNIAWA